MKKYECLYIVNINFDSEGISAVVARVEEVLKNVGGELVNTQHWGKRNDSMRNRDRAIRFRGSGSGCDEERPCICVGDREPR